MRRRSKLLAVISVLVLFTPIANDIAASSILKSTFTFLNLLDDARCVAATAAQYRAIVGAEALTALGESTECWRLFQIVELLKVWIVE